MQFPDIKDGKARVQIWWEFGVGWMWIDTPYSPTGEWLVSFLKNSIWIPLDQYEGWVMARELNAQMQAELEEIDRARTR